MTQLFGKCVSLLFSIALLFLPAYLCASSLRGDDFDWEIANTSVWLSSGTYCPPATYLNRKYEGYSAGFQPRRLIFDENTDTRGYIGVMPNQNAIYVVFRGSTSVYNWLEDLDAFQIPYPDCEECEVHEGFFYGKESVIEDILATVKSLTTIHPDHRVIVTGHSLGAALASLTALDIIKSGIENKVVLVNFGSPRFGNLELANWASNKIQEKYRITHLRDPVPHVPFHDDFTHISGANSYRYVFLLFCAIINLCTCYFCCYILGERYEDELGLHHCQDFEDPTCAYQWYLTFFTIDDHMKYLGLGMGCDFVSSDGASMTAGTGA